MFNEAKIIYALNESKKMKEEVLDDVVDEIEEDEFEDEFYDDEEVDEAMVTKVKGGKVIKLKKAPKPGYKLVDGKYVKMTAKERMARKKAIKKAQRKAHSGAAKVARKKSMKLRARRGLNDNFKFDEQAFQCLVNASLDNIFESVNDKYYSFTVESVDSATFDGSNLVLECSIAYEDGVTASGTFTVEGFEYESGSYSVVESSDLLDELRGKLTVDIVVENGVVTPVEFSHNVRVGKEYISESFELVEDNK